jgi:plastocyanin
MPLPSRSSSCAALLVLAILARTGSASTIDVKIQGFAFNGQNITISVGDTVRWMNLDSLTHTVTEGFVHPVNGSELFNHSFPPGSQSFSVTFDSAFLAAHPMPGNTYHYFCIPHGTGMVGSITVDTGPGSLYCFCVPFPACGNIDAGAGCPNSSNYYGARMQGAGTASAGADDLKLVVDHLPANKSALVLRGTAQTPQSLFYDGYLCTGGSLFRFHVQNTGASGILVQGPGVVASTSASASPILAGQTWNFQCYYRDTISPCGHQVNISNGYSVTFTP